MAALQQGVFHVSQVLLSPRAIQKRAAAGGLHRLHAGVYSIVPRHLLKREGLWMAAVLACGEGAALSYRSAAALHGLRPTGGVKIDVSVPGRSRRAHEGVKVHCSTTLTEADVTEVNGIPVTTVARTLFDLAEVLTQRQLERAFDQADGLQALDGRAIEDQLARNSTRPGAKKIRKVLTDHYIGSTPTENDFEEGLLALTRELGLPDPRPQFYIDPGDGEPMIRADFAWPDRKIAVETDGHGTHGTRQAFESDRRRDQRLAAIGWIVIRITWRQLNQRPHELRPILLKLLGPGSPNGRGKPVVAGAPAPAPPRRQPVGGSTS